MITVELTVRANTVNRTNQVFRALRKLGYKPLPNGNGYTITVGVKDLGKVQEALQAI